MLSQDRLPEAEKLVDDLLALAPDYPNARWFRAGLLRRRFGDYDPSVLEGYSLAIASEPDNHFARCEFAEILRTLGRYQEAREIYTRIGSATGTIDEDLRIEALFQLGVVCQVLGDTEHAVSAFRSVVDAAPEYPDARMMLEMLSEADAC